MRYFRVSVTHSKVLATEMQTSQSEVEEPQGSRHVAGKALQVQRPAVLMTEELLPKATDFRLALWESERALSEFTN
jgi:hypothetical protein